MPKMLCKKKNRLNQREFFWLIGFIIISQLAGVIGSAFTVRAIPTWYTTLIKPTINPPAWVFGPVWAVLYFLMGVAAFLVWRKGWQSREGKIALTLFAIQLALNALWSIIFFGLHSPGGALVEIVFLWMAIVAMIITFTRFSKPAAWLLVPYLLWVSFAASLNFGIWKLNSGSIVPATISSPTQRSTDLPVGYTLDRYTVERILPTTCQTDQDCVTPPEYLMLSRCPFTSVCLQSRCTVVCPGHD